MSKVIIPTTQKVLHQKYNELSTKYQIIRKVLQNFRIFESQWQLYYELLIYKTMLAKSR